MLSWGFIGWIVLGGIAGWIASKIMKTDAQMGILLNVVVGIVGGLLGGWLLSLFGVDVAGGGCGDRVGAARPGPGAETTLTERGGPPPEGLPSLRSAGTHCPRRTAEGP